MRLKGEDLEKLKQTIPCYDMQSLFDSLRNSVSLYRELRTALFDEKIQLQTKTEAKVMSYFDDIENRK
jgi:hypothetical protein